MNMRSLVASAACTLLVAAHAAEIRVQSAVGFKPVMAEAAAAFEKTSGHHVEVMYGTLGQVQKRMESGAPADVVVIPRQGLEALASQGRLDAARIVPIARSVMGMAVAQGRDKPDISTADAFKRALLESPRVTTVDPATGGASAIYFRTLFERMQIEDQLRPKLDYVAGVGRDGVAAAAAQGRIVLTLNQLHEITGVEGLDVVGPLPDELQQITVFSAVVMPKANDRRAAQDFVDYLAARETQALVKTRGLQPAAP
jgi:molybdate transport system substrate-binding protein